MQTKKNKNKQYLKHDFTFFGTLYLIIHATYNLNISLKLFVQNIFQINFLILCFITINYYNDAKPLFCYSIMILLYVVITNL